MRSGLSWPYYLRPTQDTLCLCFSAHGCLHSHDQGWQVSQLLTLKLLQRALRRGAPEIHHSDQGVEYLSAAYLAPLTRYGVEISVVRCGCSWENGYAERLIRTLKEEEVHLNDYENITEARKRVGHFMPMYRQKRPHSALGYFDTYGISATKLV